MPAAAVAHLLYIAAYIAQIWQIKYLSVEPTSLLSWDYVDSWFLSTVTVFFGHKHYYHALNSSQPSPCFAAALLQTDL